MKKFIQKAVIFNILAGCVMLVVSTWSDHSAELQRLTILAWVLAIGLGRRGEQSK